MSGTSRRIKYQKIKKIVRANFEKNTKEHKKQVFLHLYRCKKRKIQKSGSVRFFVSSQGVHSKKIMKIRCTVVSQSCDKRTNGRTNGRGQNHRSLRSTNGDQKYGQKVLKYLKNNFFYFFIFLFFSMCQAFLVPVRRTKGPMNLASLVR